MNNKRLAAIAGDQDFRELLDQIGQQLTAKVMATATSPEDRQNALAEYHALQRIRANLASVAHNAQQED